MYRGEVQFGTLSFFGALLARFFLLLIFFTVAFSFKNTLRFFLADSYEGAGQLDSLPTVPWK